MRHGHRSCDAGARTEKETGADQGEDEEGETEQVAHSRARTLGGEAGEIDDRHRARTHQRPEAEARQHCPAVPREAVKRRCDEQRDCRHRAEEDIPARLRDVDEQQMREPEDRDETAEGTGEERGAGSEGPPIRLTRS